MKIEVLQSEAGRWGLHVNGILIGDAKSRFDADHAKVMLEKALELTDPRAAVERTLRCATHLDEGLIQDVLAVLE